MNLCGLDVKMFVFFCLKFVVVIFFHLVNPIQTINILASDTEDDSRPLIVPSHDSRVLLATSDTIHSSAVIRASQREEAEDDILRKVDPKPAENEMNKIIDYLSYQLGGDERLGVVAEYPHVPLSDLPSYLLQEAWSVVEKESLNQYLGSLLKQNTRLQKAFIQLQQDVKRLKDQKEASVQIPVSVQRESVVDIQRSHPRTSELSDGTATLRKKNECLKIALASVVIVSGFSLGTFITLWGLSV